MAREINADSVEAWAAPYRGIEDIDGPVSPLTSAQREEFGDVADAYALLVLPNGSRFGCIATGPLGADPGGTRAPEGWRTYLRRHQWHGRGGHFSRAVPMILVDLAVSDPQRGFCCSCGRWVNRLESVKDPDKDERSP